MIYNEKEKKNSGGWVIESPTTHFLLNGRMIKIIKYKSHFKLSGVKYYHIFYKGFKGKTYQGEFKIVGTPRELFNITLRKNILLYKEINETGKRYLRRYFPEDLVVL